MVFDRETCRRLGTAGNWLSSDVRDKPASLHQRRKHTAGDRIERINNLGFEPDWAQPGYDAAGNLNAYPSPLLPERQYQVVYDAWNRPVWIGHVFPKDVANRYAYDGLGRLVEKTSSEFPKDTRRYTYSPDWRLLEEEVTDITGNYCYEYIWGIRGLDDLVCRERYDADNKLQQRYFALPDANGNVVAVVETVSSYEPAA